MDNDERVRRPKIERSEPRRNWSFGPTESVGDDGAPRSDNAPSDAVSQAVELGYRVVDEYIRMGQRAARGFTDTQGNGADPVAGWQDAASRMGQLTAEWMGLWFEFAQRAASGAFVGQMPAPGVWPGVRPQNERQQPAADTAAETPSRIRIEIVSNRPTEVSFDVRPDSLGAPLIVHSLRAADPALPRLECTFTPATANEAAALSIRVADEHGPGTYSGAVVDAASNRAVGTLSVRVS